MALRVVGGEEEEMPSARVLVNNQNTVRATVTLPNSPPRALQKRATGDSAYAQLKREIRPATGRTRKDFTGFTETSPLLKNTKHIPGILREDVHPHLDDVYQRVMRRLQRKANYQEIGAPLSLCSLGSLTIQTRREAERRTNGTRKIPSTRVNHYFHPAPQPKVGVQGTSSWDEAFHHRQRWLKMGMRRRMTPFSCRSSRAPRHCDWLLST
ncbi:hypothetical protein C3747_37g114 [Trypanosoma cruzi]|uniref:Uncharacterized protein n=1 Tax=Trypanosoma cruzi TaxID=5693 RepID=A0A2V2X0D4_TRYCR|nr:hypothetical protein C3747_37g114 [Trypanosoma cruzi]